MTDLFTNAERYTDLDGWHAEAAKLLAEGPIHRIEQPGFDPFWAVVGHQAVMEIERRHDVFHNAPQPILGNREAFELQERNGGGALRTLIHMDAPDHPKYRKLTADWFRPGSLKQLQDRLDELAEQVVDRMVELDGRCDFYRDVAAHYPLQVILSILGLPESDYPTMLKLTQQLFGGEDPDTAREGEVSVDEVMATLFEMFGYFVELTASRRGEPTEDLASVIANGRIDGEPLPDIETASYYTIIATAGHDTTSSAISGGMRALVEHPEQLRRLQDEPELITSAVDEMIRYVSPVRHFMRTATTATRASGHEFEKGDWLYLSYLAANRDPEVFADPMRFDVARENADDHLAFGFGVHFCLGAQLARMEMRTLFRHLLPRLEHLELAGEATTMRTTFVGGPKSVPISYRLTP